MATNVVELVERVEVAAPPLRVWDALTAWDRQGDWMMRTRVYATDLGGRHVGGGLTAFTGIGPLGITDTMVITEWSPPRLCRVKHTGRVVRGTAAFEVEADGDRRAVATWTEQILVPLGGFGMAIWSIVQPMIRWGVRRSLRKFALWAPTFPEGLV